MWYFSWVLGVGLALSFGIIHVMWFETQQNLDTQCKTNPSSN